MKFGHLAGASLLLCAATACSDHTITITQPGLSAAPSTAGLDKGGTDNGGTNDRTVNMMDACDRASFAAAGVFCARNGGVTFSQLIDQLQKHGSAGAWHNAPSQMDAKVGLTLSAVNKGGEIHTFTKVAQFGGGVVPEINALLHLTPTPECLAETNFVFPGGADSDDVVQSGTTLYQCCIHPWMQTVVHGKG